MSTDTGGAAGHAGIGDDLVLVSRDDDVLTIMINRPDRHNTMTAETLVALTSAFDHAGDDAALRAVVLTGAGSKTFCAGGQLTPSKEGSPFALEPERFDNPVALLFRAMDRCPLPGRAARRDGRISRARARTASLPCSASIDRPHRTSCCRRR